MNEATDILDYDYAVAPNEILKSYLKARRVSTRKVIRVTGAKKEYVKGVLKGTMAIDHIFAAGIEMLMPDTKSDFWMNLERYYTRWMVAHKKSDHRIRRDIGDNILYSEERKTQPVTHNQVYDILADNTTLSIEERFIMSEYVGQQIKKEKSHPCTSSVKLREYRKYFDLMESNKGEDLTQEEFDKEIDRVVETIKKLESE